MIQMFNHMLAIFKPKSPMCGSDYPITACFFWTCALYHCFVMDAGKIVGTKWTSFFNVASIIPASTILRTLSNSFPKNLKNMRLTLQFCL